MKDYFELYNTINKIRVVNSKTYEVNGPGDKKEIIRRLNAFDENNNFLHGWDYVYFRVDPHHPNPDERVYNSTHLQLEENMAYLSLVAKSKIHYN